MKQMLYWIGLFNMSGKDERPLKDFPRCPGCSEVQGITFWAGNTDLTVLYFDCVGYDEIVRPRVVVRRAPGLAVATLEQVNQVEHVICGFCTKRADDILFREIIKLGREIVVGKR